MLWWCVVSLCLAATSSLTSLEMIALEVMDEMGHGRWDSLNMDSLSRLAERPSDRRLLESARSYVGDVFRTTAGPSLSPGRERREADPSEDRRETFREYEVGDFREEALTVYGPFPTSYLNIVSQVPGHFISVRPISIGKIEGMCRGCVVS